jgi:hypothetical protein
MTRRLERLRRLLFSCFLVALLACLAGCNVVAMKQAGIERTMRDAGLVPASERIGADTLHYWSGGSGPTVVLVHGQAAVHGPCMHATTPPPNASAQKANESVQAS